MRRRYPAGARGGLGGAQYAWPWAAPRALRSGSRGPIPKRSCPEEPPVSAALPEASRPCESSTPATLPSLLENTLNESVRALEWAKKNDKNLPEIEAPPSGDFFPIRVTTERVPGQQFGKLKAEIVVGRSLWLYEIKHLITETAAALHQHKWTILSPPADLRWFTSDDPVIRLNFYGPGKYDFKGGWGNPGTDIFFPLSPHHLLYTEVGKRPPLRGVRLERDLAEMIRRFIAEHADRMIIAVDPDLDVPRLRPRIVNATLFRAEAEQWRRWHEDQSAGERELMDQGPKNLGGSPDRGSSGEAA